MAFNLNRPVMPAQDPAQRRKNFQEVNLGYDQAMAMAEAKRCLQCKRPTCIAGCPVHINIPYFIQALAEGNPNEAVARIKQDNALPAICGRVCPQEKQCEVQCVLEKKGAAIAIGALERFVGDHAIKECLETECRIVEREEKVAVIGSGPSGLTCAGELRKLGYQVTLYEALHELGGVLSYGIPEFRLPKSTVVKPEIETLQVLGVRFEKNALIGKFKSIPDLINRDGFKAVYIASGAGFPQFMDLPGEDLNYVYSANEFLTRINLMEAYNPQSATPIRLGKCVAVIGGGNTAMDAARCALRFPEVEKVMLLYRRTEVEMPARIEEVNHAREEGIDFHFLTTPVAYSGNASGQVQQVKCMKMALGEPDASGRRRPHVVENSEFSLNVDSVIIAIGTQANPIVAQTTPGLKVNARGYIETDENGRTSLPNVFAGGDIVSGAATVILAMGAGRTAAHEIDRQLKPSL